jgi:hypothetical protein
VVVAVGSIGAHALIAIAIASGWGFDRRPLPERPVAVGPTISIDVAPIDVALIPALEIASEVPAGTTGSSEIAPRSTRGHASVVAGGRGSGELSNPGEPAAPTGSMRMRGRRHDLTLRGVALDKFLARETEVYIAPTDERLLPRSGKHEIRDRVTTVTVARDGTAKFKDQPDFKVRFVIPFGRADLEDLERRAKEDLVAWMADPYRDQRPVPTDEVPRACMMHEDVCVAPGGGGEGGGLIGGKADITGYLHRKFIGDPYASRKLALLDSTRAARVEIGSKYRSEQLDRSSELAQRNIDALWQATADPVQRRAALFTLWDECSEGEGPAAQAGERARAIVIGWIRARLPAGSPDAFTVDEIARLDAGRTSRHHFAPY